MTIAQGTRLGPYEIMSKLGEGGMGEVYRARDTRLDRTVAIKILPASLAEDPQFRDRFDREARAISQLDHPNICALYDTGEASPEAHPSSPESRASSPVRFLVMQFLEGESLAERIARGPLPIEQALTVAVQIADALVAAHKTGIVHRDLKPGNVMLTKTGAKLLDFGLAKSGMSVIAGSGASILPTTPAALTMQGQILGTFQYMSPEQLEGVDADARSDIFAFGALLHEMVTGKKAFEGKSHASLVAAILERQPPSVSSLQPMAPAALDRIVAKCLAKDPEDRWQSAKDLRDALKWLTADGSVVTPPGSSIAAAPAVRRRRGWLPWTMAAVLFVALAASLWLGRRGYLLPPVDAPPAARVTVPLPENVILSNTATPESFALSPDGKYLVFAAQDTSGALARVLWLRALASGTAQPLPGTESAAAPFWSPDSRFIAFTAQGKLKKIDITAGRPVVITDASLSAKGAWGPDDTILFTPKLGAMFRVKASGGTAEPLPGLEATSDATYGGPAFLPDGRHFLYYYEKLSGSTELLAGSLDGGAAKRIPGIASHATYAEGHLVFMRDRTLMAQPFDPVRLELSGEPTLLADQINAVLRPLRGAFSVARSGALAYRTGAEFARTQLEWFDRAGKHLEKVGDISDQMAVELSPDSTHAVVSVLDAARNSRDLWVYDLARGVPTRLTFDAADEINAVWTPDGEQIVFNSRRSGRLDLFVKASSGAGTESLWFSDKQNNLYPATMTPDGRTLVYSNGNATSRTGNDVWTIPWSGTRTPTPILQSEFNESSPQVSPDGRWMAYVSTESGRAEVYVTSFPKPAGKWQISTSGAGLPRWRQDGKELFFVTGDRKIMSAAVNGTGAAFSLGAVQTLFESSIRQFGFAGANGVNYDVSRDGQRFLIITTADNTAVTPITLLLNWTGLVAKQ